MHTDIRAQEKVLKCYTVHMQRGKWLWYTALCLCACASVLLFLYVSSKETITIVYDGTSFTPNTVTIVQGQTITFENNSTEAFWPASNLHPSHRVWSKFDPKKPIAAGDSWSFTFTKAGNWEYHNHVRPEHGGIVQVLDTDGNAIDPSDCSQDANRYRCWNSEIKKALETGNLQEAFSTVAFLYDTDPRFASECHDIMHEIGNTAYDMFSDNVLPAVSDAASYCGYGFFHGFMESLLITSGDLSEARAFCSFIGTQSPEGDPSAENACYHGIGHGFIDGSDPRVWGDPYAMSRQPLALCLQIATNSNHLSECGNGVFNGLVIAYSEQSYGLDIDPAHIYDVCTLLEHEEFKYSCYEQLNPAAAYFGGGDMAVTFKLLDYITEEAYKGAALRTVAGTFARGDMDTQAYEEIVDGCYTLEQPLRQRCIFGFVVRLMEYGPRGSEYELGLDFCSTRNLKDLERKQCFTGVVASVYPPEKRKVVCGRITGIDLETIPECNQAPQPS